MDASPPKLLWMHSNPTSTRTHEFKTRIEKNYSQQFASYEQLRQWSVSNINHFWEEVWDFTRIKASQPFTKVYIKPNREQSLVILLIRKFRQWTKMLRCSPALLFSKMRD